MNIRDLLGCKKGFTLLEIIIVVILIGVIAAIAVPQYLNFVEQSKAAEAINTIGAIKAAQLAYYLEKGKYADPNTEADFAALGVEVSFKNWTYTSVNGGGGVFSVSAYRDGDTVDPSKLIKLTYRAGASNPITWSGNHPGKPTTK